MSATTGQKFANDGSYESVERTLMKLAHKCYARVRAMGLGMDYDDVLQEMNLTYVRALALWKPDKGAKFNSYLTTACLNNFNERIRRPARDRSMLGLVNMTDMRRTGHGEGDDFDYEIDHMERHDFEDARTLSVDALMFEGLNLEGSTGEAEAGAPLHSNPEAIIEHRQQVREAMARLTPTARGMVVEMLRAAHAGEDIPRITEVAAKSQVSAAELRRIRIELARSFGVSV
jgi:DNA-directed RNA polymerase specialized sigma24 family protein